MIDDVFLPCGASSPSMEVNQWRRSPSRFARPQVRHHPRQVQTETPLVGGGSRGHHDDCITLCVGVPPSQASTAQARRRTALAGRPGPPSPSKSEASTPTIQLPKGGGAIRGIGEKFAANPVTGTGSMSVPIATNPGRSGFGPQLSLSYDSGASNGPFGFGWSLSLRSITRKTDKRPAAVPRRSRFGCLHPFRRGRPGARPGAGCQRTADVRGQDLPYPPLLPANRRRCSRASTAGRTRPTRPTCSGALSPRTTSSLGMAAPPRAESSSRIPPSRVASLVG